MLLHLAEAAEIDGASKLSTADLARKLKAQLQASATGAGDSRLATGNGAAQTSAAAQAEDLRLPAAEGNLLSIPIEGMLVLISAAWPQVSKNFVPPIPRSMPCGNENWYAEFVPRLRAVRLMQTVNAHARSKADILREAEVGIRRQIADHANANRESDAAPFVKPSEVPMDIVEQHPLYIEAQTKDGRWSQTWLVPLDRFRSLMVEAALQGGAHRAEGAVA